MKLNSLLIGCVLCVSLAAGRHVAGADGPAKAPAADSPAGAAIDQTIMTSEGEVHVTLPPGTKSVLKRPAADESVTVQAGYEGGLVPVPSGKMADPAVRQAGGQSSSNSTASASASPATGATSADSSDAAQAAAAAAADLMTQGLTAPKQGALTGRATTLLELMGRVGADRTRQTWVVRDFWKLSAAQADYNWAADELARLDQINAAKGLESPILTAAQASAQARLREAQVGAIAAQQELADLLGIADKNQLPLAADPPLVGPYRTYFEALFATRAAPPRTRAIDRGLPIRLEAIQSRTEAVRAASTAVHFAEDSRVKGQTDLQTLLNCHSDLARQRRAFLATVRDYNLDIGEYALAVADPGISTERLVAMMILVKAPAPLTTVGRNEPTLAAPTSDDPLLQPALPLKSTESAAKNGVRRTGGEDEKQGK
jgi:hypothetical protein